MSYLEELLPEFKNGIKIRRKPWSKGKYIKLKGLYARDEYGNGYFLEPDELAADDWERYQEPIDWNTIIKNRCLCWFWDDDDTDGVMAILVSVYKDSPYCYYCRDLAGCGSSRKHCRPIRKDEVTFYEDKKDE